MSEEKDICTGIVPNTIHQLNKLDKKLGNRKRTRIYPLTYIQAVYDAKSGTRLDALLNMCNSIYLPWRGTARATRIQVPYHFRRKGLMISYRNIDNEIITEKCILEDCIKDDLFGLDQSWVRITDALPITGNVTIGNNGNWFVDGEDTGFKAQGPEGVPGPIPYWRVNAGNIEYSYDEEIWYVLLKKEDLLIEADNIKSLFINAGATYNEETSAYEVNGITDITEDEMCVIYNETNFIRLADDAFNSSLARTTLPNIRSFESVSMNRLFKNCTKLEVLGNITNLNVIKPSEQGFKESFYGCAKLTTIIPELDFSLITNAESLQDAFTGCVMLNNLTITHLKTNVSFADCIQLSKQSLISMIESAENSSSIQITLNQSLYEIYSADEEITSAISAASGSGHEITLISA